MPSASFPFLSASPKLTVIAVIDILAVAFLIYQFIMIVRGRRSAPVLSGVIVLGVVYLGASSLGLELLRSSLAALAPYTAFALIVMFQSDIRRVLARLGRGRWFGFRRQVQRRESAEEILLALAQLSMEKTGALVVLERDIGLRTFIESGVLLDAMLSRDLLLSIFQPSGAMHDGAVIVQGERIAAAACFLPLTMSPTLSRQLGTRHRAAIGITEESDALALIVSEETGRISVAVGGEIELNLSLEQVTERIARHFGGRVSEFRPATVTPIPISNHQQANRG